jgi:hypothetical protein
MSDEGDSTIFKIAATGSAIGAAMLGRKAATVVWKVATGNEPPVNPEDPEVTWKEAVAWALASGAVIGLARLLASRQAAVWYRKQTGRLPANLQKASA